MSHREISGRLPAGEQRRSSMERSCTSSICFCYVSTRRERTRVEHKLTVFPPHLKVRVFLTTLMCHVVSGVWEWGPFIETSAISLWVNSWTFSYLLVVSIWMNSWEIHFLLVLSGAGALQLTHRFGHWCCWAKVMFRRKTSVSMSWALVV